MKPKHLVVDTAAFVKCLSLWEYGEELYSVPDVVQEIRDKQARERYEALPVHVKMREPQPWAIRFINQFSKKTGDYASLSLADVKILALTYELEIEVRGCSDHLRSEPKKPITEGSLPKQSSAAEPDIEGFHVPAEESDRSVTNSSDIPLTEPVAEDEESHSSNSSSSEFCLDEITAVNQLQNMPPALSSPSHNTLNSLSQDSKQPTNIYWRHMLGLEDFLSERSYIGGYSPTSEDDDVWKALIKEYPQFCPSPVEKYASLFCALNIPPTTISRPLHSTFPCIRRWSYHISSFSIEERSKFPSSDRKLVDILHDFGGRTQCWGEGSPVPDLIKNNTGLLDSALQNDMSELTIDEQNNSKNENRKNRNEDDTKGDPSAWEGSDSHQEESGEEETEESVCEDDAEYDIQQSSNDTDENTEVDGKEYTWEEDECDEEDDDDDEGWITPSNIKRHKLKNNNNIPLDNEEEKDVLVACITSDFAMQNVLKHIGLSVMGVDGKLIWQIRTFILRCYACFKTTSNMTKIFCPKCGNKTLKRVSVTVNPDGTQKIWINFKKPINTKGMRFSLPRPKGGQHARNPILVADQKEVRQFSSKMGKKKVNPLHEDYDPDSTPFATRDVYSRAAQLGYIGGKCHNHFYWERRNPNAHVKKIHKKK